MQRRPRRFFRRLAALAPALAALGGQALAAGSLRASFLPHVGTTPAPWFLSTASGTDPTPPSRADVEAGLEALRAAVSATGRADLGARLASLVADVGGPSQPVRDASMSFSRDIEPPGAAAGVPEASDAVTR